MHIKNFGFEVYCLIFMIFNNYITKPGTYAWRCGIVSSLLKNMFDNAMLML